YRLREHYDAHDDAIDGPATRGCGPAHAGRDACETCASTADRGIVAQSVRRGHRRSHCEVGHWCPRPFLTSRARPAVRRCASGCTFTHILTRPLDAHGSHVLRGACTSVDAD